jgi:hypothetical protein
MKLNQNRVTTHRSDTIISDFMHIPALLQFKVCCHLVVLYSLIQAVIRLIFINLIYLSAAIWLSYVTSHVWCTTGFSASTHTVQRTLTICCIIRYVLNCFFGLSVQLAGNKVLTHSLTHSLTHAHQGNLMFCESTRIAISSWKGQLMILFSEMRA